LTIHECIAQFLLIAIPVAVFALIHASKAR